MHTRFVLRTIVVALLGMLFAGPSLVTAQGTSGDHSGISVIGQGESHAPADRATLHITVGEGNYAGPALPQPGAYPVSANENPWPRSWRRLSAPAWRRIRSRSW